MESGDGVVGEERVVASGEREVVAEVAGGFGEVHRFELVADRDALIEGGEDPHAELPGEGGLPDEEPGERGGGVHVGVRQQSELFELFGGEQVGFVDDDHGTPVAFGSSLASRVGGLGHDFGFVEAGCRRRALETMVT